jgi:hypothetical protein
MNANPPSRCRTMFEGVIDTDTRRPCQQVLTCGGPRRLAHSCAEHSNARVQCCRQALPGFLSILDALETAARRLSESGWIGPLSFIPTALTGIFGPQAYPGPESSINSWVCSGTRVSCITPASQ